MKKIKTLLLGLLVLSSLLLASCQGADNQSAVKDNQAGKTVNKEGAASSAENLDAKVNLEISSQQSQQVYIDNLLGLQDQLSKIVAAGKIDGCKEIKDPIYNESCQVYILSNQAKSKTDTGVCDASATPKIKELCLLNVGRK